jgi:hypothetical protein
MELCQFDSHDLKKAVKALFTQAIIYDLNVINWLPKTIFNPFKEKIFLVLFLLEMSRRKKCSPA